MKSEFSSAYVFRMNASSFTSVNFYSLALMCSGFDWYLTGPYT